MHSVSWVFIIITVFFICKLVIGEMAIDAIRGAVPVGKVKPHPPRHPPPIKKVATCQFCGTGIVPGAKLTNCPSCGAPIVPLAAELPTPPKSPTARVPGPGPSSPLYRTGMEQDLWRVTTRPVRVSTTTHVSIGQGMANQIYNALTEYDELRGDNEVIAVSLEQSAGYVDPYLDEYVARGIMTAKEAHDMAKLKPDTVDYRLLGEEKR